MEIDTDWFIKKIAGSRFESQRRLAPELGMDQSALSRMLRGQRDMTAHEAVQLALLLDLSLIDVIERSGVKVPARIR